MSKSHSNSGSIGRIPAALIGLVVVFLIALAVNYIFAKASLRVDLTEDKIYTLSEGTKKILTRLDTPVTIRYYVEDEDDILAPQEKAASERVEQLLNEYGKIGGKLVTIEKLNPEPDTDAEDSAVLDGLQRGGSQLTGSQYFMGISVKCVDATERIPFVLSKPETLLEYDLSRAIATVHDGATKNIKVMSSMQIGGGGFSGNPMAPPPPAWYFMRDLQRDNNVETIDFQVSEIPPGTDLLIVLHPYDITEQAQFAIDQYLLKGGNVIAIVDPSFFFAQQLTPPSQNPMMPAAGGPGPSSDLDKLFNAWGIQYDSGRVLADAVFQMQLQSGYSMTALTVTDDGMNADSPISSDLSDLLLITPGAFDVSAPEGVEYEVLVHSSDQTQLVSSMSADPLNKEQVDAVRKNFESSNQQRAIAVRLSGTFKTAFPDGDPSAAAEEDTKENTDEGDKEKDDKEEKAEEKPADDSSIKESQKPGTVIAIADADFIYDAAYMQAQNFMGQQIVQIHHGANLNIFQNSIDLLLGADELIEIRKRSSSVRSFVKINDWLREAEAKFRDQQTQMEESARNAETRINEILQQKPDNIEAALVGPEIQAELENLRKEEAKVSKQIRDIRKQVRRDFESRLNGIKFWNIFGASGLVLIVGIVLFVRKRYTTAAR